MTLEITTDFVALLLEQVMQVYRDNTEDYAAHDALEIVLELIRSDGQPPLEPATLRILEEMALLADWMLRGELSAGTRARLERIRDEDPIFGGPAAAAELAV